MNLPLPPAAGPPTPASVSPVAAVTAVAGTAPVTAAEAVVPATPTAPALSLSAQAQQALRLQVFQTLIAQLVTQVQSGAQATAAQWPAMGTTPALRELLTALIAQATAGLPQPQQLVAAQPWPQAWLNTVLPAAASVPASAGSAAPPPSSGSGAAAGTNAAAVGAAAVGTAIAGTTTAAASAAPRLPPMLTWLVQQGVVRTPEGERGFALTLQVPQAWAQLQAAASALLPAGAAPPGAALLPAATGPAQLQLPFAAPAQQLESGALALVLQGAGPGGEKLRTSALLWLDFQPLPPAAQSAQSAATALAGLLPSTQAAQQALAALQAKNDPWLQMAVLQASGQQPRDDQRLQQRRTGLCTELGCPYRGKASCAQPFCAEMNRVWASARIGPTAT
ncbi:hypothetical protein [Pantoea sp. 18069]|uniref:hypothetical protein n=1 Tax=Pantoea sp. 18069 TaxID=2681415 RepID=UPI00190F4E4F|nr:hypothetical protein [Pantoea sp. 18069]